MKNLYNGLYFTINDLLSVISGTGNRYDSFVKIMNAAKRSPILSIYNERNTVYFVFKNTNYSRNEVFINDKHLYREDKNTFSITVWNEDKAKEIVKSFKRLYKIILN